MDYRKIYNDLIVRCKHRGLSKGKLDGYYEKHHIKPRCMGGKDINENYVLLTGREHLIAHMLLVKIYPKEKGLIYAVNFIRTSGDFPGRKMNGRQYEWTRIAYSNEVSKRMKVSMAGSKNNMYGVKGSAAPCGKWVIS